MKKGLILAILATLVVIAGADTMQTVEKKELPYQIDASTIMRSQSRTVPSYSFIVEPQSIVTTFYDYMPGSYISYPLRVQSNMPHGQNGAYIGFHATETANATRRAYYAYINGDGTVNRTGYLSPNDLPEGYVGTALDHSTQDPFFTFHNDIDEDGTYEVVMSYDMWDVLQGPGLVATTTTVLEQDVYAGVYTPNAGDEFIWPYTYIVNGPNYDVDGSRRLFVVANNYTKYGENPSENVLIAYTDFTDDDVSNNTFASLTWNYITFPVLDDYNQEVNGIWGRYNKGVAFNDAGQCAMIGYISADDVENGSNLLVFYNDNWGEGEWTVVEQDANFFTVAPSHLNGDTIFEGIEPGDDTIFYSFVNSSHPNARFDNEGRLHFLGNMVLGHMADGELGLWAPFSYPKGVIYDPIDGGVTWQDVYPQSTNENPTFPYCPWDPDQDGEWEYNDDGLLLRDYGWPIWWYVWDDAFHENSFKYTASQSGKWMAAVWQDGLYARFYNEDGYEEYADWATCPEIAISLSADNGNTWSEPIFMNANPNAEVGYCEELDGMIPNYVYPGDIIENLGDGHGKLHLFFLDDNSWGSFIQENGANDGGTLMYTALDVDFSELPNYLANNDDDIVPVTSSLSNFPNPFNPTTTISFSIDQASDVELKIYNVRGELVKTVLNESMTAGAHTVTWTGADNNNSPVASGVYFCKMTAGSKVETSKMLLLK